MQEPAGALVGARRKEKGNDHSRKLPAASQGAAVVRGGKTRKRQNPKKIRARRSNALEDSSAVAGQSGDGAQSATGREAAEPARCRSADRAAVKQRQRNLCPPERGGPLQSSEGVARKFARTQPNRIQPERKARPDAKRPNLRDAEAQTAQRSSKGSATLVPPKEGDRCKAARGLLANVQRNQQTTSNRSAKRDRLRSRRPLRG